MENIARYIIRASFSKERMTYIPEESKVVYQSKDDKEEEIFDALKWLAAMCSHVPDKGEQMVHYYGYYSNIKRGRRKNKNQDEWMPCILEPVESPSALSSGPEGLQVERPEGSTKEYRKNWASLIQKIHPVEFPKGNPIQQGE